MIAAHPSAPYARTAAIAFLIDLLARFTATLRSGRRMLTTGKRKPMAAYRFGGLAGTLFRPGESGLMSMIG